MQWEGHILCFLCSLSLEVLANILAVYDQPDHCCRSQQLVPVSCMPMMACQTTHGPEPATRRSLHT